VVYKYVYYYYYYYSLILIRNQALQIVFHTSIAILAIRVFFIQSLKETKTPTAEEEMTAVCCRHIQLSWRVVHFLIFS